MALNLNEYIKMSYERPNRKVLEGLGASEGLIEYLMETPGNTNWNVIGSISRNTVTITYKIYWGSPQFGITYTKTINSGEIAPIPVGLVYCLIDEGETFFIENGTRNDLPEISGNWWCITLDGNGLYKDFDYYFSSSGVSSPSDGDAVILDILEYDEDMDEYYYVDEYLSEPVNTNLILGLNPPIQFYN